MTTRHWPLLVAVLALAGTTALALGAALALTSGRFVYALDDAYIYLAMAKNLARTGTWGLTPFGFSSSASSPLWLLLLSGVTRLFGAASAAPLVLNLASAIALLAVSAWALRRAGVGPRLLVALLLAVVLLTPVIPVAFCGLDHLLHAALAVAFLSLAAEELSTSTHPGRASAPGRLAIVAALLVAARYEGLFLVGAAAALLAARGRARLAIGLTAAGALPALAYGLFSRAHGAGFFPSSVVLKAHLPWRGWSDLPRYVGLWSAQALGRNPHLLALIVFGLGVLLLARRAGRLRERAATMVSLCLITTLLHVQLARTGMFFRYEAYLVAMWLVALGASLPELGAQLAAAGAGRPQRAAVLGVAALFVVPLAARAAVAHRDTPRATSDIFRQQYQMGLFVRDFFPGRAIAANDVGAINYLADIDNLDLAGLGTIEVARAMLDDSYDTARIDALARARRTEIAIVYEHWFERFGGLPSSWRRLGRWTLAENVVAAGPTVSFFAVDPGAAPRLEAALRSFAPRLPAGVTAEPAR